jgi:hypothetical protein
VASGAGVVAWLDAAQPVVDAARLVDQATRRRGPVVIEPSVWILQGNRATQVPADQARPACEDLDLGAGPAAVVVLQG